MIYEIKQQLRLIKLDQKLEAPYVEVILLEEWESRKNEFLKDEIKNFKEIDRCKIKEEAEYLWGTFVIPAKNNTEEKRVFLYIIRQEGISFVDYTGSVAHIVQEIATHKTWKKPCIESFMYTFLEHLIENDYIYLREFENKLSKLEDSVVNGNVENFNHKMMAFRKEIAIWHHYYMQLIEVGRKFKENESMLFKEDGTRLFSLYGEHVMSLQNTTQFLREYAIHIREAYQTQIDIKQNKIMEILTIVTTIFLPLTLITGWYGMNFEHMPELKWEYGYPAMILGSIIVVMVCMRWFKRKNLL